MPRADATQEAVTASSIVEELDVVEDVGTRELASFVDTFSHALFFRLLKKDSTALSQQLPRRLMLDCRLFVCQNWRQSSLPYCVP